MSSGDENNNDFHFDPKDFKEVPPEYSPFNPKLDEKFPVGELLTDESIGIIHSSDWQPMHWVTNMFKDSPVKNTGAEMMMGDVVEADLNAGQWVDIPLSVEPTVELNEEQEVLGTEVRMDDKGQVSFNGSLFDFGKGGAAMLDKGFLQEVSDDDGNKMYRPTEKLVQFIWDRTQKFSPRRKTS